MKTLTALARRKKKISTNQPTWKRQEKERAKRRLQTNKNECSAQWFPCGCAVSTALYVFNVAIFSRCSFVLHSHDFFFLLHLSLSRSFGWSYNLLKRPETVTCAARYVRLLLSSILLWVFSVFCQKYGEHWPNSCAYSIHLFLTSQFILIVIA